jgi:hypothetical protein
VDYEIIDPLGTWQTNPSYLEFELPTNRVLNMNQKTFFEVQCKIQRKNERPGAEAADPRLSVFLNIEPGDATDFILSPNWFDHLITKIDIVMGNQVVATHNLPDHVLPTLNSMMYYYMDKNERSKWAPDPCHPGNCLGGWGNRENQDKWQEYVNALCDGDEYFKFAWRPLNTWPFCQTLIDEARQKPLPMQHLDKMLVRLTFRDDYNSVLKAHVENDKPNWKLELTKMELFVEEDLPAPTAKLPKRQLSYQGHSLSWRYETIPPGELTYKTRFMSAQMPQQMGMVFVHKDVLAGKYDFQKVGTPQTYKYFRHPNLQSVSLMYDGHEMAVRTPNFQSLNDGILSSLILSFSSKYRNKYLQTLPTFVRVSFTELLSVAS